MFDAKDLANLNYSSTIPVAYHQPDGRIIIGLPTGYESSDGTETVTDMVLVATFDHGSLSPLMLGLSDVVCDVRSHDQHVASLWYARVQDMHHAMWRQQQDVNAAEQMLRRIG